MRVVGGVCVNAVVSVPDHRGRGWGLEISHQVRQSRAQQIFSTALLLNEVSEKKLRKLKRSFRNVLRSF